MEPLKDLRDLVGAAARAVSRPEVVIVHEDFSTGLAAKQLIDQLFGRFNSGCKHQFKMWEFSALRLMGPRAQAVREAAQAPIVCLSAHGDSSLLVGVKDWAERWARETAANSCGLVVLLGAVDRSPSGNTPMIQFLRHAANQRGASFLLCSTDPSDHETAVCEATNRLCNLSR
jgi:hypothetical protein